MIEVSSCSEYKVKNGLSCIGQFKNLGQNGTYYIAFDEWKDIRMYTVCGCSEPEYTSDFGKQQVFSFLQGEGGWGTQNFKSSLGGADVFSTYVFNFRNLPGGNK